MTTPRSISTKRGDGGETDLLNARRVPKNHARLHAIGDLDELNAVIGTILAAGPREPTAAVLERIQQELFVAGTMLACAPCADSSSRLPALEASDLERMEKDIQELESGLPPLKAFILPGGDPAAAALHHARTVCRRAERSAVSASSSEEVDPFVLVYLNRLSDLLFLLAREENRGAGKFDPEWNWRDPSGKGAV